MARLSGARPKIKKDGLEMALSVLWIEEKVLGEQMCLAGALEKPLRLSRSGRCFVLKIHLPALNGSGLFMIRSAPYDFEFFIVS